MRFEGLTSDQMRVLLQNSQTKLYFIDANEWTDDPLKATDFEEVEHAADVYHTCNLAYARIIVDSETATLKPHLFTGLSKRLRATD